MTRAHKAPLPSSHDAPLLTGRPNPSDPNALLNLQRSVGNQAVLRIIQRLPSVADVKAKMGKKKRSLRIGHGSTKYKAILDALGGYKDHVANTKFDPVSFVSQFQVALSLLATLEAAVKVYSGKTGTKADYFTGELAASLAKERGFISQTALNLKLQGLPSMKMVTPTLAGVMLKYSTGVTQTMDESKVAGKDKGGSSEVTKFDIGGQTSFFKETKQTLNTKGMGEEDLGENANALINEKNLGVDLLGIDPNDARMANRDVAMYRLDQLLGGDLIAKAELVKRQLPGGEVKGSLMEGASGDSAKDMLKAGKVGDDATDQASKGAGAISMKDPTLMRLLSRLQFIDLLAMQIDRNTGNFFIETDNNGNVTGITGIDNDYSLGTESDINKRQQELPGFSRYVDKAMANQILAVDLGLVGIVMADLLSPAEIQALMDRFSKVKAHLAEVETNLLDPNQWDDAVSKNLLDEQKSYYADIEYNKAKLG